MLQSNLCMELLHLSKNKADYTDFLFRVLENHYGDIKSGKKKWGEMEWQSCLK